MLPNYKSYKFYPLLEKLLSISYQEKDLYINSGKTTHITAKEIERQKLGMGKNEATGWYIVPVIRNKKITDYASDLPLIRDLASSIPGLVNCTLNIYYPGYGAPLHSDYDYDLRSDMVNNKKCFVVLLSVEQPSTNIEECGFEVDGESYLLKTGDITMFDGSKMHRSWNNTDKFRYTINIDIEQEYFQV